MIRAGLAAALLFVAPAVAAQPGPALPFTTPAPRAADSAADCPAPPTPTRALAVRQAYAAGDASYSQIDPAKQAARDQALAPVRAFTAGVARFANSYVASDGKDVRSGTCALRWLGRWAQAGALTSLPDHDAQFVLSVNLSGWALSFLQVDGLRVGDGSRVAIRGWLRTLAVNLQRHTDGLPDTNKTKRNNHRYWAGLATMAVGTATGDGALKRWALASARIGLDQVTPEGALPLELERAGRALHYHLYAAEPLVMTAELAGGDALYGYRGGALQRLVAFSVKGIAAPTRIEKLAGARQTPIGDPPAGADRQRLAWLEFYARRFPGRVPTGRIFAARPLVNPELGGNLTMLAARR